MSATPDDALKAVEALAQIMDEEVGWGLELKLAKQMRLRLQELAKGCQALREGRRGDRLAQNIIQRDMYYGTVEVDPPEGPSQLQPGSVAGGAPDAVKGAIAEGLREPVKKPDQKGGS